jgi:hypothetical protein
MPNTCQKPAPVNSSKTTTKRRDKSNTSNNKKKRQIHEDGQLRQQITTRGLVGGLGKDISISILSVPISLGLKYAAGFDIDTMEGDYKTDLYKFVRQFDAMYTRTEDLTRFKDQGQIVHDSWHHVREVTDICREVECLTSVGGDLNKPCECPLLLGDVLIRGGFLPNPVMDSVWINNNNVELKTVLAIQASLFGPPAPGISQRAYRDSVTMGRIATTYKKMAMAAKLSKLISCPYWTQLRQNGYLLKEELTKLQDAAEKMKKEEPRRTGLLSKMLNMVSTDHKQVACSLIKTARRRMIFDYNTFLS